MGRWAGLAAVVDVLPFVHAFRHPSKAFFTTHLCASLLLALGIERRRQARAVPGRRWRRSASAWAAFSCSLRRSPGSCPTARWFLAGFLPPSYDWPGRASRSATPCSRMPPVADCWRLCGAVAGLVLLGQLRVDRGRLALVALVTTDLLRTGAGLNPMVTARFYEISPELRAALEPVRANGRFFAWPMSRPAPISARVETGLTTTMPGASRSRWKRWHRRPTSG